MSALMHHQLALVLVSPYAHAGQGNWDLPEHLIWHRQQLARIFPELPPESLESADVSPLQRKLKELRQGHRSLGRSLPVVANAVMELPHEDFMAVRALVYPGAPPRVFGDTIEFGVLTPRVDYSTRTVYMEIKSAQAWVLEKREGHRLVQLCRPELLSYGSGPTLPFRYYVLYKDGTLGYCSYEAQVLLKQAGFDNASRSRSQWMQTPASGEQCPVCMDVPFDLETACGHHLCHRCLEKCVLSQGPKCPLCRAPQGLRTPKVVATQA